MNWNLFSNLKILDFRWWANHGDFLGLFVVEGACLSKLFKFPAGSDFFWKLNSYSYFENTGRCFIVVFLIYFFSFKFVNSFIHAIHCMLCLNRNFIDNLYETLIKD